MAEKHLIYHWKHGWIPLTHAAALSKAKGNPKLADKYVAGTSTHHAPRATAGVSARNLHTGLEPHKHTPAADVVKLKPGDHATLHGIDEHGHDITVTGTVQAHPKPVRIKHGEGGDVHTHYQTTIANRDGQATVYTHVGPEADTPLGRQDRSGIDREYFGKTGPELKKAADGGDPRARAELDRRAAKRAEKAGKPAPKSPPAAPREKPTPPPFVPNGRNKRAGEQQAPDMTPEQLRKQNQGDYQTGDKVKVYRLGHGTVTNVLPDGRLEVDVPGHGKVRRSAADLTRPKAGELTPDELRKQNQGDYQAGEKVLAVVHGAYVPGTIRGIDDKGRLVVVTADGDKVFRTAADLKRPAGQLTQKQINQGHYKPGDPVHVEVGGDIREGTVEDVADDGKLIVHAEPHIRVQVPASRLEPRDKNAPTDPRVLATRRLDTWRTQDLQIERTLEGAGHTGHTIRSSETGVGDGRGFHTHYRNDQRVGSVIELRDGRFGVSHQGVRGQSYPTRLEAHQALAAAADAKAIADAEKLARDRAERDRRFQNAKPIGAWQPHSIEGDGSGRGEAAAQKIKQAFKFKGHTVEIEAALNKEQTKGLLDDIHSVLLKSGHLDSQGIVFRVPTGDSMFREKRTGTAGAYVMRGTRAIHINPKLANETIQGFQGGGRHFMPARDQTNARQYVIAHELGHVLDGEHMHTFDRTKMERLPSGLEIPNFDPNHDAAAHHRTQRPNLSNYGTTNKHEGYAEAYAQWIHGGPGSNPAADDYALKYGWAVPAQFRHRGRI